MGIDPGEFRSLSGFAAGLYQLGDGTFILAIRGTTPSDIRDLIADVRNAAGTITVQYDQGLRLAGILTERLGSDLLITGHSLGGGIAAAQALKHGCRAVTFNAAGLHDKIMKDFSLPRTNLAIRMVTNYVVEGEIVTAAQESVVLDALVGTLSLGFSLLQLEKPMYVPEAVGTRVGLKPVPRSLNIGKRHKIEHVIVALESLIRSREQH